MSTIDFNASAPYDGEAEWTAAFLGEEFYTYDDPLNALLIAIYAVVFLLSVAGNVLVLVVVHANRASRSVTNYFLLNLAIADLLGEKLDRRVLLQVLWLEILYL